jgi:hypothetical protein
MGNLFFGRARHEAVASGEIHNIHGLTGRKVQETDLAFNGYTGVIADPLAGASKSIEKSGFAGIGIARNGEQPPRGINLLANDCIRMTLRQSLLILGRRFRQRSNQDTAGVITPYRQGATRQSEAVGAFERSLPLNDDHNSGRESHFHQPQQAFRVLVNRHDPAASPQRELIERHGWTIM